MPIVAALVAPLAMTLGFFTSASSEGSGDSKKKESSKSKKNGDNTTKTVRGTPIADPPPNIGRTKYTIVGDFLYWRADEDGLTYGLDVKGGTKAKALDPDFEWRPGYRAGAGFQFNRNDNWDMMFIWTGLNSHTKDHFVTDIDSLSDRLVAPRWSPEILGGTASSASLHWRLRYNTIDWYLGRDFFVGRQLTLHPIAGVRGAWISQKYDAHYLSQFVTSTQPGPFSMPTSFDGNIDFKGVGMRAGFDLKYHVTKNFGFCGSLSGALFYGWTNLKERIKGFQTPVSGDLVPEDLTYRHHFQGTRTNLEGGLGLLLEGDIRNSGPHITLTVKYEFSEWFNQNVLTDAVFVPNIVDAPTPTKFSTLRPDEQDKNLGLQGLTVEIRVDF